MAIKQLTLFIQLFQEFADSYPYSSEGLNHRASYEKQRQQGRRNFEEITTATKAGEDITELVIFKLLPHTDTPKNRERGAWIHINNASNIDLGNYLTVCFEWWEHLEQKSWSFIAREIYNFVHYCTTDYDKFLAACKNLSKLPYFRELKAGIITPILNALKPDDFILINNKSTKVINYLSNTQYTQKLTEYPYINLTGHNLILELAEEMQKQNIPAMRDDDLFDMFCHWLVDVKKYNFPSENINSTDNIYETNQDEKINLTVTNLQPEYSLKNSNMPNRHFYSKLSDLFSDISEKEIIEFVSSKSVLEETIEDNFLQRFQEPIFKQLPECITKDIISVNVIDVYTTDIKSRGLSFMTKAGVLFVSNAGYRDLQVGFVMSLGILKSAGISISGRAATKRLQNNIYQYHTEINSILTDIRKKYPLEFVYRNPSIGNPNEKLTMKTMEEWIIATQNKRLLRSIAIIAKIKLLDTSNEDFSLFELSKDIVLIFKKLFPLVLLAKYDDPMPVIYDYLSVTGLRYPLSQCSQETNFTETQLTQWIRAIARKKQAIFQGPPGTGKTFLAQKLAQHLITGGDGFWELIQFHPAYTYEDFIQGIRPQSEDGKLTYPVVAGRFLQFCQKAALCQDICVLIIDEINRANLSQVFGELMYLLEYRNAKIPLANSGELFSIPENVRIIGTMNTADRSIALVDHALRRRFAFITLSPNYEILRQYHKEIETNFSVEGLIKLLEKINQEINDPNYQVGVSFFLRKNIAEEIQDIWQMEIEPYLEEYFFAQPGKVDEFRWGKIEHRILG